VTSLLERIVLLAMALAYAGLVLADNGLFAPLHHAQAGLHQIVRAERR